MVFELPDRTARIDMNIQPFSPVSIERLLEMGDWIGKVHYCLCYKWETIDERIDILGWMDSFEIDDDWIFKRYDGYIKTDKWFLMGLI